MRRSQKAATILAALFTVASGSGFGSQSAPPRQTPAAAAKQAGAAAPKQAGPATPKQAGPATTKQAAATAKHVMLSPDDLKWGEAPPALPSGAQLAVLDGDPGAAGLFTVRLKIPDGYKVPPHSHPTDEHLSVMSGTLKAGLGAKWDDASMHALTAGSYAKMPRLTNHFVVAQGETVVQITAMGPFAVTYVNPKDDPRKKTN